MPPEVLSRLRGYLKKDSFPNDTVKSWKKYMVSTTLPNGDVEWNVDPNLPSLDPSLEAELYINLFRAFRSMSQNKWAFDDNDAAIKFVDKYFGNGKVFSPKPLPANILADIKDVIDLIINDANFEDLLFLERKDIKLLKSFVSGNVSIDDNKVGDLVYNTISNLKQQIARLKQDNKPVPDINAKLHRNIDFRAITDAMENIEEPDAAALARLRNNYKDIFSTLYQKKGIRDVFQQYDSDKTVSNQIDIALKTTDYTGKTNENAFVPPQYEDKLNLPQKIKEKTQELYDDVLKKFVTAHRDNIFIKPTSKAIFKAFDKAEIKPTDGLPVLLKKSEDVLKNLKGKEPFDAPKHFKWLIERLSSYDKNGKHHAIEGAIRNGAQMRNIVEQLIKDAVNKGEEKQAKTALEVLSVMQYGLFTSRTMDAINKTDMTIFSDGKLSWNKNEGIKMVTGAFDKTIKFGIQATGYGITALTNSLRRTNRTFDRSGDLERLSQQTRASNAAAKSNFETLKRTQDQMDDATIQTARTDQTNTGITDINAERNNLQSARNTFAPTKEIYDDYTTLQQLDNSTGVGAAGRKQILESKILTLQAQINALPYPAPDPITADEIETKMQEYKEKQQELTRVNDEIDYIINTKYAGRDLNALYGNITRVPAGARLSQYDREKQAYDDLQNKIDVYDAAQEDIDNATEAKREREEKLTKWDDDHKDSYMELMAYWDFLQSGNTKSLFHISTKKLQAKMNSGKMQTMLQNWNRQYAA